ncbi:hypothetical protein CAPSP0001_1751 [Capnocytophaga sputigena ATCC 33612]|nr:hypothetical protein CAPSP0001_1751 [Capnocytophaga sputigena ATCC 33612]
MFGGYKKNVLSLPHKIKKRWGGGLTTSTHLPYSNLNFFKENLTFKKAAKHVA